MAQIDGHTPEGEGEITQLLHRWREGNSAAENELFGLVLPELRRIAGYIMSRERKGHTLQPTELVDQIYVRLVAAKDRDWQNRQHFFAIAARAMRRYLVDHARARSETGFVQSIGLEQLLPADPAKVDLAITVDRFLDELAQTHPDWCTLVELKYFLGLNNSEASEMLGVSVRTMQRMWHDARRWLFQRMESGNASEQDAR